MVCYDDKLAFADGRYNHDLQVPAINYDVSDYEI